MITFYSSCDRMITRLAVRGLFYKLPNWKPMSAVQSSPELPSKPRKFEVRNRLLQKCFIWNPHLCLALFSCRKGVFLGGSRSCHQLSSPLFASLRFFSGCSPQRNLNPRGQAKQKYLTCNVKFPLTYITVILQSFSTKFVLRLRWNCGRNTYGMTDRTTLCFF